MSDQPPADATPAPGTAAPSPMPDPGNAPPEEWSTELDTDELDEILAQVDDPTDPVIVAGLAGTLYDPDAHDGGNA